MGVIILLLQIVLCILKVQWYRQEAIVHTSPSTNIVQLCIKWIIVHCALKLKKMKLKNYKIYYCDGLFCFYLVVHGQYNGHCPLEDIDFTLFTNETSWVVGIVHFYPLNEVVTPIWLKNHLLNCNRQLILHQFGMFWLIFRTRGCMLWKPVWILVPNIWQISFKFRTSFHSIRPRGRNMQNCTQFNIFGQA